jgi:hypothetical protein
MDAGAPALLAFLIKKARPVSADFRIKEGMSLRAAPT